MPDTLYLATDGGGTNAWPREIDQLYPHIRQDVGLNMPITVLAASRSETAIRILRDVLLVAVVKTILIAASLCQASVSGLCNGTFAWTICQSVRDHLSVGLSVCKVYCGKMAKWIRMPFGMVSCVGRGMGVLDGGGDRRREGAVLGVNLGRPIVTNKDFATRLFPGGC